MDPLSLSMRRRTSFVFFALFAVVLLAAFIYASGYRFDGITIERTGGIHLSVPLSGARISLNGSEVGTSGFLARSFFIDNLRPGSYMLSVEAPRFHPWNKTIIVERALVTDANAFMISKNLSVLPLVATTSVSVATTTRAVTPLQYRALEALFSDAATSIPDAESGTVELIVRGGNVFVRWNRELSRAPSSFCFSPRTCVIEVTVESGESNVIAARFFKEGVVYQTEDGGIFFAEIDVKPQQVLVPLFKASDANFRLVEGELFITSEDELFVVSGL